MIRFFKTLWKGWLKVAHAIGVVNSTLLLILCYVVLFGVARVIAGLTAKDLLDARMQKDRTSYWKERKDFRLDREALSNPF